MTIAFNASFALSWREVGHFSVCEIAYQNLTPVTKRNVDVILGGKSFAEQCTWPDMVRKSPEWKHTYDWHFVNVEDHQNYMSPDVVNKKGDVITAILKAKKDLGNTRSSSQVKRTALLFLGHFIGDIHQVVHIGRKSDLGGNKFYASWFGQEHFDDVEHLRVESSSGCLGPFYVDEPTGECVEVNHSESSVNLHKIWDFLMVDTFIQENRITSRAKYPYKEYVKAIDKVSPQEKSFWQDSSVLDWAQESLCYRPRLYNIPDKKLGRSYYKAHINTLNTRMLMAGYRLAVTLNRIFEPAAARKYQGVEKKERELVTAFEGLLKEQATDLRLSLDECSAGVYRI